MSGITGPLVARATVTAVSGGAAIPFSGVTTRRIRDAAIVQLVAVAGYNADVEFSTGTGAPRVLVPDDTEAPDTYVFYQGPGVNAPLTAYAASSTPVDVLLYKMRT